MLLQKNESKAQNIEYNELQLVINLTPGVSMSGSHGCSERALSFIFLEFLRNICGDFNSVFLYMYVVVP